MNVLQSIPLNKGKQECLKELLLEIIYIIFYWYNEYHISDFRIVIKISFLVKFMSFILKKNYDNKRYYKFAL